ncbi:hypothetical protein PDJAM_G00012960 [Pangasius djambal]|uniref:Uncharacterized protein n=1 Tax=Pangasius djambal TaxID=1691987 RepID=A0ACC5YLE2_9TELE|nr:hypothetical protein [Pangasius djambal]
MEFGFVIFLLSSTLLGRSSGFTTRPVGSCSGHFTERAGEFASPQYPNRYPHYAYCTWRIQNLERKFIVLRFLYVDIEAGTGCRYDAVHVYDGSSASSPLLGSVCGSQTRSFSSSGSDLTVVFASDNTGNGGGFVARWVFTAATTATPDITTGYYSCRYNCGYNFGACSCSSSCQYYGNCCYDYYGGAPCGGNLTQSRGEFFSPNYPHNYPNNARCTWTLLAEEMQVVSLTFTSVDLESCCDHIRVYDGPNTQHTLLGSVSGNWGATFNSSSRYMTVFFSTDSSVTRQDAPMCKGRCGSSYGNCSCGSSCERYGRCCHDYYDYCYYTTSAPVPACGGRLYGSGSISSPYYPGYYHDNAYCVWQLSAPAGQTIFLSFQDFDLERCCNCDYVNVYDGPSTASHLIGKLCNNNTNHLDFQSSSSYMTVLFRSDYSGVGRGFKAYFSSSVPPNTGRVDCSSDWMNIVIRKSYLDSLGFNWYDLYLDDHRCRASADYYYVTFKFPLHSCSTRRKLSAPAGQTIFLSFQDFDLERCCNCDYVNVYDGPSTASHLIGKLCNNNTNQLDFQSSSSYMTVLFRSDYSGVGRGFKAYFSSSVPPNTGRVDCSSDWMNIVIRKSYLDSLGFNWYDLYLDDHRCRASADYYYVTFKFPLHSCSTRRKFSFRAFKFLRTHNQVFLRCDVVICADNDYNSRCRQGCRYRRKRSLSSDHHTAVVTLGPITQKDPEEAVAKTEDKE